MKERFYLMLTAIAVMQFNLLFGASYVYFYIEHSVYPKEHLAFLKTQPYSKDPPSTLSSHIDAAIYHFPPAPVGGWSYMTALYTSIALVAFIGVLLLLRRVYLLKANFGYLLFSFLAWAIFYYIHQIEDSILIDWMVDQILIAENI